MGLLVWWFKIKPSWKTKNCVIWIQNFIVYIKTDDIYEDIAEDVETRSGTWNWELDEPLRNGKKVIGLMRDEWGGKIRKKIVWFRAKKDIAI